MVQLSMLDSPNGGKLLMKGEELGDWGRPTSATLYNHSDPVPTVYDYELQAIATETEDLWSTELRDASGPSAFFPLRSQHVRIGVTTAVRVRQSSTSTCQTSPSSSRPHTPVTASSRRSFPSSHTSGSVFTVDTASDANAVSAPSRPSILSRLRSSISTQSTIPTVSSKAISNPSNFRLPSESPEKRFIDSVGMVIPGVCDRIQCLRPLAHFVINWRLCEPIEYTTALADHGITHTDYSRLVAALRNFLDDIPNEPKPKLRRRSRGGRISHSFKWFRRFCKAGRQFDDTLEKASIQQLSLLETDDQFQTTEQQAVCLNRLLEDITWNWRAKGVPVMVCVGSFSIFSPSRISEAHIQIIHVPLQGRRAADGAVDFCAKQALPEQRDVPLLADHVDSRESDGPTFTIDTQALSLNPRSVSPSPPFHHHHQAHLRDRSQPWALWPNAIPVRKRDLLDENLERYGVDPYFRAWVRANVNSHTRSTSYAKYMIEREDDPFVNKRLGFIHSPPRTALIWSLVTGGYEKWKQQYPNIANRLGYEHNRRLECRKTVEAGSRLRIARFAFRHPLYPPHTQEMDTFGLNKDAYDNVISYVEAIRRRYPADRDHCTPKFMPLVRKVRRKNPEGALPQITEYIKNLNAKQRGVVWTIEEIPGVYDRGVGRKGKEWEISVWNGADPLELLLQLERWGIIDKKLTNDEED